MQDYQKEFIAFAIEQGVLCFGEFTLKSGRRSPYFFNSGLFNDGASLERLGSFYRRAIEHSKLEFDMLFGPAYKGIPLATAVAISYASAQGRNLPWCFDRKEEKDHGEGGMTLGASLCGRVLLVDDVITAGTSFRHSREIIERAGAQAVGICIALDRQEKGQADISAIEEIQRDFGIEVISIITLDNLVEYLESAPDMGEKLGSIIEYRDKFGVNSA